jgi:hypothetical protein
MLRPESSELHGVEVEQRKRIITLSGFKKVTRMTFQMGILKVMDLDFYHDEFCIKEDNSQWNALICQKDRGLSISFYSVCEFATLFRGDNDF